MNAYANHHNFQSTHLINCRPIIVAAVVVVFFSTVITINVNYAMITNQREGERKRKKSDKCSINAKRKNQNIYITFDQNDAFVETVLCHTYPVNALVWLLRHQTDSTMLSIIFDTHTHTF